MSSGRAPRPRRARRLATTLALAGTLAGIEAGPAEAQAYGQWSWRAVLRASRRSYDNRIADTSASSQRQDDLGLGLWVNGFVLHPAFLTFTAGADVSLTSLRLPDRDALSSRLWGFGLNASLLPRGRYPLTVYARRRLHDDPEPAPGTDVGFGVPTASTSYGGRLRLRDGPLRGALVGLDRSHTSYRGDQDDTLYEKAFASWSRVSERHQRHARIERRVERFGIPLFETRNLALNYDQFSNLGDLWRLRSTNVGLRRALNGSGSDFASNTLRSNDTATRPLGETGQLRLDYTGGATWGQEATFQSHEAAAEYSWRPGAAWTTSVLAGYGMQRGGGGRSDAPRLSGAANWAGRLAGIQVSSGAGLGVQWLRLSAPGQAPTTISGLVTSLRGSAQHGTAAGLRKELEMSWSRNRLRTAGEVIEVLPDLGSSLTGLGTENDFRARLTLAKRWRGYSADGYSEYTRRQSSRTLEAQSFRTHAWTHVAQISTRRVSLTLNSTETDASALIDQHISSQAAALSLRPVRWAAVTGLASRISRDGPIGPEADGSRYEVRADLRLGDTVLEARWYRMVEEGPSIVRRENRGFYVSLTRSLSGWLPIVTGISQGGVIR